MPITLGTIANRTKAMAYPFAGDAINLTYHIGKITEAWKAKMLAFGGDATNTDADALAFLDQSLLDLLVSWDVLDKPADDGGVALPLAAGTFANLDIGFKMDLLLAIVHDSLPGEANGAPSKPTSVDTSPTMAK